MQQARVMAQLKAGTHEVATTRRLMVAGRSYSPGEVVDSSPLPQRRLMLLLQQRQLILRPRSGARVVAADPGSPGEVAHPREPGAPGEATPSRLSRAELQRLTAPVLRAMLEERGLQTAGLRKAELVQAMMDAPG